MTDPQFASTLFDSLVDAGTSPQEIIDGGFEELITNIQRQANEIAEVVWEEAIKRLQNEYLAKKGKSEE